MKIPNKLKSTKLWITIWSILLISFIVVTNKIDFFGLAQLLSSIPLAYIGANVWQKNIYSKSETITKDL